MDLQVRTYDPKLNVATFGTVIFSGYAEDEHIAISQPDDSFETVRGSDGGVDRINKNVYNVIVTITLKASSPINDILSSIHRGDKLANTGKLPLVVKNINSASTVLTAPQAWIVKPPDMSKGNSLGTYAWVFHTGPADYTPVGNVL